MLPVGKKQLRRLGHLGGGKDSLEHRNLLSGFLCTHTPVSKMSCKHWKNCEQRPMEHWNHQRRSKRLCGRHRENMWLRGWIYAFCKLVREEEKCCVRSSTGRNIKHIAWRFWSTSFEVHLARTTSNFVRARRCEKSCYITLTYVRIYCKTQKKRT